jgi:hypothetical protein
MASVVKYQLPVWGGIHIYSLGVDFSMRCLIEITHTEDVTGSKRKVWNTFVSTNIELYNMKTRKP